MIRMLGFTTLFLIAVGLGLVRGARPERLVSTTFLAAWIATLVLLRPVASRYASLEVAVMIVDVLTFVALLSISLAVDRFWPMFTAACQGMSLLGHFAEAYGSDVLPAVYLNAVQLWAYPQVLALLAGVMRLELRRRDILLGYWPFARPR